MSGEVTRIKIEPNKRVVVTALGLLPGERFIVRYVVFDSCGKEDGVVEYRPNGCPHHMGLCDQGQENTGNPIQIDTHPGRDAPGVYEFVPEGVVGPNARINIWYVGETIW